MILHSVDFTGGDFNMSTFSTVGDAFSDHVVECTGFIVMPQQAAHMEGSLMRLLQVDNADLGFGPRFISVSPTFPGLGSIMRSDQAQQRRMDRAAGQE